MTSKIAKTQATYICKVTFWNVIFVINLQYFEYVMLTLISRNNFFMAKYGLVEIAKPSLKTNYFKMLDHCTC